MTSTDEVDTSAIETTHVDVNDSTTTMGESNDIKREETVQQEVDTAVESTSTPAEDPSKADTTNTQEVEHVEGNVESSENNEAHVSEEKIVTEELKPEQQVAVSSSGTDAAVAVTEGDSHPTEEENHHSCDEDDDENGSDHHSVDGQHRSASLSAADSPTTGGKRTAEQLEGTSNGGDAVVKRSTKRSKSNFKGGKLYS